MINNISIPGSTYSVAVGSLEALSTPLIVKRISSQWQLAASFLGCISKVPIMIAAVPDIDKRQKLADKFSKLFVQYIDRWNQMPLHKTLDGRCTGAKAENVLAEDVLRSAVAEALAISPPISPSLESLFTSPAS